MPEYPINQFVGPYRFLSNFFPALVMYEGDIYPSVEHAYQAAKVTNPHVRLMIRSKASATDAKRAGRQAQPREDWDQVKLGIMENLVRTKFAVPGLALKLINTGDRELIEGNTWGDTFWGVCDGVGQNHLGKILMKVRHELQSILKR